MTDEGRTIGQIRAMQNAGRTEPVESIDVTKLLVMSRSLNPTINMGLKAADFQAKLDAITVPVDPNAFDDMLKEYIKLWSMD